MVRRSRSAQWPVLSTTTQTTVPAVGAPRGTSSGRTLYAHIWSTSETRSAGISITQHSNRLSRRQSLNRKASFRPEKPQRLPTMSLLRSYWSWQPHMLVSVPVPAELRGFNTQHRTLTDGCLGDRPRRQLLRDVTPTLADSPG